MKKRELLERVELLEKKVNDLIKDDHIPSNEKLKEINTWYDLGKIGGYWVDADSEIVPLADNSEIAIEHKNVFPTKQDAESSLALAQLLQIRKAMVGDWVPEWDNTDQRKWCVSIRMNYIEIVIFLSVYHELSFPTYAMAENFRENNLGLIKKYYKL